MASGLARGWLEASELRIGLGCMRLPADEDLASETIAAALAAGVTVFDTAHAYGRDGAGLGENERLLARTIRRCAAELRARVVTKGGMARTGGGWLPDGRARTIVSDCEASLASLGGLPIDTFLLHAPDPRTPWQTSVRALARVASEGMAHRVGLSNVNLAQLDAALELAPIAAVEVPLSLFDDRALRGGVVARCTDLGIAVIAHSPLGGPRRARGLARRRVLAELAAAHGATAAEVALAWLLALSPTLVAIPGARHPEAARDAARAGTLELTSAARGALAGDFRRALPPRPVAARRADVVLVMGIPGAGKTRLAERYVTSGYVRLNRDARGGALREIADALDAELAAGAERLVLDNTYLTRASRSYVLDAAHRHGACTTCLWLSTPLAQAQVNMVERLLEAFGALPTPEELRVRARHADGLLTPTSQMRALRELEPPSVEEGFDEVEVIEFERGAAAGRTRAGVFVARAAVRMPEWERALEPGTRNGPVLVFDWLPGGSLEDLDRDVAAVEARLSGVVAAALCPHGAGPPVCWCRPPLPGLLLAFARGHGVDPARSQLVGTSAAHRTLAATLGARYTAV